jgi:TonB family protein
MSPARARLFADAAVKRFDDQRRRTVDVAAPAAGVPRPSRRILIGAAAAAIAVLVLASLLMHDRNVEQSGAGTAPAQPAASAAPSLSGQPIPAVKSVLMEAQERLLARARAALDQQRLDDAASAIEAARKAGIATERVAQLATELARARELAKTAPPPVGPPPAVSAPAAAPTTPPESGPTVNVPADSASAVTGTEAATPAVSGRAVTTPAVATPSVAAPAANAVTTNAPAAVATPGGTAAAALELLKSARQSLAADRLVEPENDNAQYYLLQLRKLDAQYVGLPALIDDLGARLVAKGQASLNAQQFDSARDWLDHAAAIGYASPQADTVRHDLDATAAHRAFMTDVISANQLALVKSVQPQYPPKAEKSGIEGWVDLDFTVTDTGAVQDVVADTAKPPGVFDVAARAALLQWRFKPLVRDGKAVATRARIRIRFALGQ